MDGKAMERLVFLPWVAVCLCLAAGCGGMSKATDAPPMLTAGQVTATNNPQVALYAMTLPMAGSMTVEFGTDTNYGLKTWAQSTDTAGGKVSVFVAGMKAG